MEISKEQAKKICFKFKKDFEDLKFLGKGNHNENYLLTVSGGIFVLRIENNTIFKNLKREHAFLKKTEGKFGPKVFLFDNSRKIISRDYLVEEYIDGEHPKKKSIFLMREMALWYHKLHNYKEVILSFKGVVGAN